MIDHISIRVSSLDKSAEFYEKALGAIGYKRLVGGFDGAIGFAVDNAEDSSGHIWLVKEDYVTTGVHIAFAVPDMEVVKKFYAVAMSNGGRDNGAPGRCPEYGESYYGGFVLDPDGNDIEATTYIK